MVTASAPGKVYLFGEHAVVYGEPAVACAVERRAHSTAETRDDGRTRISAPGLSLSGVTVEYGDGAPSVDVPSERARDALAYVEGAIEQARDAAEADTGLSVTVESDLPLGAGLSSSAAVVVATLAAAGDALGADIDDEELADRAFRVEYEVQDGQASRTDTFCSTVGGAVRVEGEDCRRLGAPELPLVVGYDGGSGDTGELVAGVRELRERYGFAADTVSAIGDVVRTGEELLAAGDREALGEVMDVNHGLLSALGVSAGSLDAMAWCAREAGALGAKLTGAGGGGCIVALDPDGGAERALSVHPDCEVAFEAALDRDGVVVE
jgi:mevalonate kinase